jgi:hypothetical protein
MRTGRPSTFTTRLSNIRPANLNGRSRSVGWHRHCIASI